MAVNLLYTLLLYFSILSLIHAQLTDTSFINLAKTDNISFYGRFDAATTFHSPAISYAQTHNPQQSVILRRTPSTLEQLAVLSPGGVTNDVCMLGNDTLYFGGAFTAVNDLNTNNVIAYEIATGKFTPLLNGLNGQVRTVYCDQETKAVYFGGDFRAPAQQSGDPYASYSTFGGGLIKWQNNQWMPAFAKGLNGPVHVITPSLDKSKLLVGGQFDATADGAAFMRPTSQPLNLASANVTASGGANPASILCGSDQPWLLPDGVAGSWRADVSYGIAPLLLRLRNVVGQDRGARNFSIAALPGPRTLNMSYFDVNVQRTMYCTDNCLLQLSNAWQDFTFPSGEPIQGLQITINGWYGTGAGLSGVEIYQSSVQVHSDDRYNAPACGSQEKSQTTTAGTLQPTTSATGKTIPQGTRDASLTFSPNLPESGTYEVYLIAPPCTVDGSCANRNPIYVELTTAPSMDPIATILSPDTITTNRLLIFSGTIQQKSDTFAPKVTVTLATSAITSASPIFSVDMLEFVRQTTLKGLNGIAVYDRNATASVGVLGDALPYPSTITSIVPRTGGAIVAGEFSGGNVATYQDQRLIPFSNGGVNRRVNSLCLVNDDLFMGGEFNATADQSMQLYGVARYSLTDNVFSSLGGGVIGNVYKVAASNTSVHVAGAFSAILVNNAMDTAVSNYAVWNTKTANWASGPLLRGQLSGFGLVQRNAFVSGAFSQAEAVYSPSTAVINNQQELVPTGYEFSPLRDAKSSVTASAFYTIVRSGTPAAGYVVAGSLVDGQNTRPLARREGSTWTFLNATMDGPVNALCAKNDVLYMGGAFSQVFRVWDLVNDAFVDNVATVQGDNATIHVIKDRQGSDILYVAGSFSDVSASGCVGVCAYDVKDKQWRALGKGLKGTVYDLVDYVVASGLIGSPEDGDLKASVAAFDFATNQWAFFSKDKTLPGIPTLLTVDNTPARVFVGGRNADGSPFIQHWDGSQFNDISKGLLPDSSVRRINVVPLSTNTPESSLFGMSHALLASGNLNVDQQGRWSGAVFDGSAWVPYLRTSNVDGTPGEVWGMTFESLTALTLRKFLPLPLVILVAAAISLGIVALIALAALLFVFIRRRRVKPDDLLQEKTLIAHAALPRAMDPVYTPNNKDPRASVRSSKYAPFRLSTSRQPGDRSSLPVAAFGAQYQQAEYQVYYARFPFGAREPGELEFQMNDKIYVLDNSDEVWWMGMVDNGPDTPPSQGVFPASYVSEDPLPSSNWNLF